MLLDIHEITTIADYFVICTASSDRMIRALVKEAVDNMAKKFNRNGKVMGSAENGWVAIDFQDIVLHVFSPRLREFYKLEELWNTGKILLRIK